MATIAFTSTDMAQFVADIPRTGATVNGTTVTLDETALAVLADQPDDADGHYDGTYIWVGGTEYPVR